MKDLIEKLGEKQEMSNPNDSFIKPILIGDIAFKIAKNYHDVEVPHTKFNSSDFIYSGVPKLFELWIPYEGKSLQEIMEKGSTQVGGHFTQKNGKVHVPKTIYTPDAQALVDFLNEIL